jgi:predicted TIM-barrel fold metal-dependent hydrolase
VQNVHTHAWDQSLHIAEATAREADLSRGYPLDLTVHFDAFMRDMEPFERIVVFGLKAMRTGYWVPDDFIADFVARAPQKLVGFASCDPTQPGHVNELERAVKDLGLRGVKMGPAYAGFDPRDERCAPVYACCQAAGIPIIFHTGTTFNREAMLAFSRPWLFDEVAMRFPELRIVLAHLGHPWHAECLAVIRKHPHLYADIAALYYRPWQFYNMMVLAQEYKVTHKLLFGTDYPFAGAKQSVDGVRGVSDTIGGAGLPAVQADLIESILERDAFSLLGLS